MKVVIEHEEGKVLSEEDKIARVKSAAKKATGGALVLHVISRIVGSESASFVTGVVALTGYGIYSATEIYSAVKGMWNEK